MLIGNVEKSRSVDIDVRQVFSFPDPVSETSARLVAVGVVLQGIVFLAVREPWLLGPLVYGFLARILSGPSLSPLGQLSIRVATPFVERTFGVESRRVPGPPKRFAQLLGLAFTAGAGLAWFGGLAWLSLVLVAGLVVAASLEAFAGICAGCIAYSAIWGCDDCNDISERLQQAVVRARETVPSS